jgi:hypothetical protein
MRPANAARQRKVWFARQRNVWLVLMVVTAALMVWFAI